MKIDDFKLVISNEECALLDAGDGICCLQFRSKGNSISLKVRELILEALAKDLCGFDGMIIANEAKFFSAGANLFNMKDNIENQRFDALADGIKAFHETSLGIKYYHKPIVSAPYKQTFGGGLEVCLHTAARVALAKSYMGLVESGVGLIPGGGGTKCSAMLLDGLEGEALNQKLLTMYEKLLLAKVSKNAEDAKALGYLSASDIVVGDMADLLPVAKAKCLNMVENGYKPPEKIKVTLPGKEGYDLCMSRGLQLLNDGVITAYDYEISKKTARVLCGSAVEGKKEYSEDEIMAIERECFMELLHTEGTYKRIAHFCDTGEKLRN